MSFGLDSIFRGKPINKTANLVTQKGIHFNSNKKIQVKEWDKCPKISYFRGHTTLNGRKFGKMTVVGLSRDIKKRWIVQCECGKYTIRTAKAIKNPENNWDCCEECRNVIYLRKKASEKIVNKEWREE